MKPALPTSLVFCFFGLFPGVGYARQNSDRSIRTRTYSGDESAPDPVAFELLERSQSMQRGWRQVHELKLKIRIQEAEIIAVPKIFEVYLTKKRRKRAYSINGRSEYGAN